MQVCPVINPANLLFYGKYCSKDILFTARSRMSF